jgi:hypothetical protein
VRVHLSLSRERLISRANVAERGPSMRRCARDLSVAKMLCRRPTVTRRRLKFLGHLLVRTRS